MDDSQAVRRLKSGDINGLDFLVTRYQCRAVQAAYLILHDEQLAEDVVQDSFVRIYQRIRQFDETRPFEPYLLRSVINAALNAAEKSNRWIQYGAGVDVQRVAELLIEAVTVEEEVEYSRLKGEIVAALAALPPRQRLVVVQRYYLGMNEKEMAETLSAPPGTIKWLLNAARQRLRTLLSAERNVE
jgi:RNA polymerase sigma-70 factor, ECF subfamily